PHRNPSNAPPIRFLPQSHTERCNGQIPAGYCTSADSASLTFSSNPFTSLFKTTTSEIPATSCPQDVAISSRHRNACRSS
ncbi:hypothetical protein BS47DRAFT_1356442, partial [Hydnum rufescens UP504]